MRLAFLVILLIIEFDSLQVRKCLATKTDSISSLWINASPSPLEQIEHWIESAYYDSASFYSIQHLNKTSQYTCLERARIHLLYIKSLNYKESYQEALLQSQQLEQGYIDLLQNNKKELKEFYYQKAYSNSGIHNQKYEILYTTQALEIMNSDPNLFSINEFIQTHNDLHYYQLNYEDIVGCEKTYGRLDTFLFNHHQQLSPYEFQYGRRVLRKMQITDQLFKGNVDSAYTILSQFKDETYPHTDRSDIDYILSGYAHIASHLYFEEQYLLSIQYTKEYLAFAKEKKSYFNQMLAQSKLAIAYERLGQYETAIHHVNQALNSFAFDKFNASYFALQIIKAKCYSGQKNYSASKQLIRETLENVINEYTVKNYSLENYPIDDMLSLNSHNYINIFATSGQLLIDQYRDDANQENLTLAEKLITTAALMFNEFYQKGEYNPTLYKHQSQIAESLLFIATEKYSDHQVKVIQLLNQIEENASKHLFKSYQAKSQLDLHQSFDSFTAYENTTIIDDVQKKINSHEAILKYYIFKNNAYLLSLHDKEIHLKYLGKSDSLRTKIEALLYQIKNKNEEWYQSALELKDILLPEADKSKYYIISDNFLNYLPFEIFNECEENNKENRIYSYSYSLAFWNLHKTSVDRNAEKKTIIYNPVYEWGSTFNGISTPPLMYAQNEAKSIANITHGRLLHPIVKKSDFLESISDYAIHHFAMHSIVDESNYKKSCLVFSNNEALYFEDLYHMQIPASLIVLGACNTGSGKIKNGEGIMSLSSAFTFAGTRNILYSLWETPDAATAQIMTSFYDKIYSGYNMDEALHESKKEFILRNPTMNHPYFWAGFIINGEPSPIVEYNFLILYILLGILLIDIIRHFLSKQSFRFLSI